MNSDAKLPLIVLFTNAGAVEMCLNTLYSMRRVGIEPEHVRVYPIGDAARGALEPFPFPIGDMSWAEGVDAYHDFGGEEFLRVVHQKLILMTRVLREARDAGRDVLYVDTDLWFWRDPRAWFAALDPGIDIAIQTDTTRGDPYRDLCTGLIYCRPSDEAIRFWDLTVPLHEKMIAEKDTTGDQIAFNRLFRARHEHAELSGLQVEALPRRLFPNGEVFFRGVHWFWRKVLRLPIARRLWMLKPNPAFLVHNNYTANASRKVTRFKQFGLWGPDRPDFESVLRGGS